MITIYNVHFIPLLFYSYEIFIFTKMTMIFQMYDDALTIQNIYSKYINWCDEFLPC